MLVKEGHFERQKNWSTMEYKTQLQYNGIGTYSFIPSIQDLKIPVPTICMASGKKSRSPLFFGSGSSSDCRYVMTNFLFNFLVNIDN